MAKICIGKNENPVYLDFSKSPHLLIAGATGSGKSVCMNRIIYELMKDSNNRFVLIDPKRVEFYHFRNSTSLYNFKIIEDVNESITMLEDMNALIDTRFQLLKELEYKDIYCYNAEHEEEKINDVYICIDELSFLILQDKKRITDLLSKIGMLGRAAGVHLICATQRPDREIISGQIQANFTTVIGLKVRNAIESRIIVSNNDLLTLEVGQAIVSSGLKYERIKISMLEEIEIENLIDEQLKTFKIIKTPTITEIKEEIKTEPLTIPAFVEENKEQEQEQEQTEKKKTSLNDIRLKFLQLFNNSCYILHL